MTNDHESIKVEVVVNQIANSKVNFKLIDNDYSDYVVEISQLNTNTLLRTMTDRYNSFFVDHVLWDVSGTLLGWEAGGIGR